MIFNVTGGGGAALNFKVLAYATEEALLAATPAENTIGIITATPITRWLFSAAEPSPAENGMVWFRVGTFSPVEFNALKKNGLQVYPLSARQYVSGAWVDVIAKSYQGGEWVDWIVYLYKDGNQYDGITGSWGYNKFDSSASFAANSDCIVCSSSFVANSHMALGFVRTNKPIDLTSYTTAYIVASVSIGGGIQPFMAVSNTDTNNAYDNSVVKKDMGSSTSKTIYSVDVSTLQGSYYVGLGFSHGSSAGTSYVTIYEYYLR